MDIIVAKEVDGHLFDHAYELVNVAGILFFGDEGGHYLALWYFDGIAEWNR